MAPKPRTKTSRILSVCAWALMAALGVWEIKVRHHWFPGFSPLFQIAVATIAFVGELTGLLQEPR
jgi:hypothetical protein